MKDIAQLSSCVHNHLGLKSQAYSPSPLKWTKIEFYISDCVDCQAIIALPNKVWKMWDYPVQTSSTYIPTLFLTKLQPKLCNFRFLTLTKPYWIIILLSSPLERTLPISPEIDFRAGFGTG